MRQYKTVNNLMGWFAFAIAAVVYCMTIEPTASFWDCGEFITSAYKLEVGHPPGAPFFMLTANFFTLFTNDPTLVARMVNTMSALMSAACILFLFWSITHLVRKLVVKKGAEEEMTTGQLVIIMGSGLVGALAYTFSDTFWFSAVEGEVYAYSSLFTALVFWLILKWENVANEPHSDRWIILIAYLTGLSIGVHLLNLLCLPAIVLVYYYKKNPDADLKGSLLALAGSGILVAVVLYGIVPGVVKVGGWFELFFVNTLGLSFNSGVIVYIITISAVIIWGIYESYTQGSRARMNISFLLTLALLGIPFYGHGTSSLIIGGVVLGVLAIYLFAKNINTKYQISARTLNTSMLCILTIMIGYSSYALIVIRSTANTPMDQNSPEDIFTLGEYLGREQYGTRPLFYGQTYASKVALDVEGKYCVPRQVETPDKYVRKEKTSPDEKDLYIKMPGRLEYEYAQNMLFPRMYSQQTPHIEQYKAWANIQGHEVLYDQCGETVKVTVPTQWENIKFFFSYQLNFMYWRYFMWNFVGRQNDIQGQGEIEHGNWITGIKFIDNVLVGNQDLLPQSLKENKGRNVFYGLPLLLGIIGLLWQANRDRKGVQQFWVVFFLFFMTGLAIILYLNQSPLQVRERDYAYAGSFYAFAIWIGMGVAGIAHALQKRLNMRETQAAILTTIACLCIPIQMVSQTWDDHDRSGRYVCRDFGQNYLMSLQESGNPIIFTNGDNDTFPLWYNQETEEFRTDARTCNLSYLQTDWYIDQMKRPAYDSPSLPITWNRIEYTEGNNEYISIRPEMMKQIDALYAEAEANDGKISGSQTNFNIREVFGENPYELENILNKWIRSDSKEFHFIPTDSIVMKIDKEAVRRSGMKIPEALGDSIPDYMHISLKGKRNLYKSELIMLEMLCHANWERPLYMAITVGSDNQLNMGDHFVQEGLAYRFTPFNAKQLNASIDTEKMYDNLMNKFKFGGIEKEGIYIDENVMRMCYTHRRIFAQLIDQLLKEGKKEKALTALEYCEKMIPAFNVPYEFQNGAFTLAEAYYKLGKQEEGDRIIDAMANNSLEYTTWYLSMNDSQLYISAREVMTHFSLLDEAVRILEKNKSEKAAHYSSQFDEIYKTYVARMKNI
ncbi:DUF2723 domain-containing protein [Bacteroides sp. 224]|uniref:glycosyltransferase family 117 protein n=1 Tax=Bacteroides sp. 224 TaxID=2302936 RepID=UPI0013D1FF3C|nr:DUF2723 domain-containing protein [Bacteroides sp. 224]NDV65698.1 DUF2723 domain-containing protein [Bacteroides sp. 224]